MSFFDQVYRAHGEARAPWEIDAPQPEIVALAQEGAFVSPVLDVGCGSGENALYLASRGFEVVGVDIAPTAIALAEQKAAERGLEVPFLALDALDLPRLGRRFPTAIDSGLFHVFSDEERPRFADAMGSVVDEGGTYFMICFSEHQPGVWGPRRVTQAEIRATFSQGWRVASIRPATFLVRLDPPEIRAWLATIMRGGRGAAALRAKRGDEAAALPRRRGTVRRTGPRRDKTGGAGGRQPPERSEEMRLLHSPGDEERSAGPDSSGQDRDHGNRGLSTILAVSEGCVGAEESVTVVVEIPKGSRNKYERDPHDGHIYLDRMLFTSTRYPSDYGFIDGTLGGDGDPLDALVLLEEPTFPGCRIRANAIGLFRMWDEKGPDEKILCVPLRDPQWSRLRDIEEVPSNLLAEIEHFFQVYKTLEQKPTGTEGFEGREAAQRVIAEARARAGEAGSAENPFS